MKKLIASVFIAFVAIMNSVSFAQDIPAPKPSTSQSEVKFYVRPWATGKIDVTIVKSQGEELTIQVIDEQGNKLASKSINKKDQFSQTRFDLNELPDGVYRIVALEGSSRQVKEVILNTTVSESARTVNVG
jgi:hypothetical protein